MFKILVIGCGHGFVSAGSLFVITLFLVSNALKLVFYKGKQFNTEDPIVLRNAPFIWVNCVNYNIPVRKFKSAAEANFIFRSSHRRCSIKKVP